MRNKPTSTRKPKSSQYGNRLKRSKSDEKGKSKKFVYLALALTSILVSAVMVLGESASSLSVLITATNSGGSGELIAGKEVVGMCTSVSSSTDTNRETNIKLAAAAINNTIIPPNGTFSFNVAVGDTSSNENYKEANTIIGNEYELVRGGGICQVSSALYKSALIAGLENIERHPHSIAQDYIPLGLDATVSYKDLDLIIKNTTGNDIVIVASASGQQVDVTLYGTNSQQNIVNEATSEVVETYSEEENGESVIYYVVDSYLLVYEDGELVQKEFLSKDTYKMPSSLSWKYEQNDITSMTTQ